MKDSLISKLIITKTRHKTSQFKKISDALPVLCVDKNYQSSNEVLRPGRDLVETDFIPPYPNATQWSTTHHVQINIVDPNDNPDDITGERPVCYQMMEHAHVFDANLQKKLLSEYKRNSKDKSQEYTKFLAVKKILITILVGQYDEAIKTEIVLGATYAVDRQAGRLLVFIERMRTVCLGGDDGGLSYGPYKQVVAIKSLNAYTNNESQDPHGFKEYVKIKYEATKTIAG